jgi:TonB family protein
MKYLTITVCALILFCADYSLTRSQTPTPSPNSPAIEVVQKASEVTQKARVKKKPEPKYTKDAKKHNVEGTVVLRCVFRSTGEVTNISVIRGLPDGLTDRAIEAAKKIKFIPAMKDGHPVSMWMQLEYNFNLY